VRKSIGTEPTFDHDLEHWGDVPPVVDLLSVKVWDASLRGGHAGRTVTVKVKYADFQQITRSRSCLEPIAGGTRRREGRAAAIPG
jgi:DNA polymerase-4